MLQRLQLLLMTLQAGMTSEDHPERLMIALEPEAASIYVRKLRLYQLVPDTSVTQTLSRNSGASARANRYSYYAPEHTATGNSLRCYRYNQFPDTKWQRHNKPATEDLIVFRCSSL